MWEIVIKIFTTIILSFAGAIVIHNLSGEKLVLNIKNVSLLIISGIISSILYSFDYEFYTPIISCLTMTIVYKYVFKLNFKKSLFYTIMLLILAIFSEVILSIAVINFTTVTEIRESMLWSIIGNVIISFLIILASNIKVIKIKIKAFDYITINKNYNVPILFIFLLLIILSISMIFMTLNYRFNYKYLITILLMVSIFIIAYIYIKEKIAYDNLNKQYDILLDCIQTFEDWIEKEQLSLHESKNQLVILKSLVKNSKALQYLNEIIKDKIIIENSWINDLKHIPSGGLKGLLYYKLSQTKIKNIDVELNIQHDVGKNLSKLSIFLVKELCQIVGIYFDNAIEATETASRKVISLEIYLCKNNIVIVLSNYIDMKVDIEQISKKGYSTKGIGRGNGLFFAKKIIEQNSNVFSEKLEIKDNYYVKKLIIKYNNKN
ncbi:MAG: GHKL domain-containing protein [Bacilli bacterium]